MDVEIGHLASCLHVSCGSVTTDKETKLPVLRASKGCEVKGLGSIAKFLARKCGNKDMLGRTSGDQALVDQWLEYRVTQVDRISQEKDQQNILKELNSYLEDRVYLVGFYLTVADVVLYLGLYKIFSELSFFEKQQYLHLSRWFDQVQYSNGVKQNLKTIFFQKGQIYSKSSSH